MTASRDPIPPQDCRTAVLARRADADSTLVRQGGATPPAQRCDSPAPLILASGSPYRRELLERLRVPFKVAIPAIDEMPCPGETPAATALRLAEQKARAVAAYYPEALVIGSDQVTACNGQSVGKPGSHKQALAQLQTMRGRLVEFHSAVCLYDVAHHDTQTANVITRVRFRDLDDVELNAYLEAETPYDVAGSAKSEGLGIVLFEAVESDDPTALIGLPLIALASMLRHAGYPVLEMLKTRSQTVASACQSGGTGFGKT